MSEFEKTYVLPFKYSIPNLTKDFFRQNPIVFRWFKFKKRQTYIKFKRQKNLEIDCILPSKNRILWINLSAPSLGDSLMDLSSRVLLKGKNIDLFTDKKNADLYFSDKIFRNVFTNENEVVSRRYDLIIIDSFSSKSIRVKAKLAPLLPFVGIYGYYNGPDVNRVLYSFH